MAGVTMFMLSLPLPRLRKMCPSNTRLGREVGRGRTGGRCRIRGRWGGAGQDKKEVEDRREVQDRGKKGMKTRRQ